jgi:DNA-binding beta-propeller fold protein YncE
MLAANVCLLNALSNCLFVIAVHRDDARTLSGDICIRALAIMGDELYVGRLHQSVIEVYDVATLDFRRNLSIPGLRCVIGMASCPQCNVVYVSDQCDNKIFVFDESGVRLNWSVAESPRGLSVNSRLNLIVTFHNSSVLRIFTRDGELLRNVTLQPDITYPWHAIQLDGDRYAVVHGYFPANLHRVCIVDGHGTVVNSYGGKRGTNNGQLDRPYRVLMFGGSLIVTDFYNFRLRLFSVSPFAFVTDLMSTRSDRLWPRRLALSEDGTQLFVSYQCDRLRTFNLTWTCNNPQTDKLC